MYVVVTLKRIDICACAFRKARDLEGKRTIVCLAREGANVEARMSSGSTWTDYFPGNFMWSNATLIRKVMTPYGAVAIEEIERIGERLAARGMGDADPWADAAPVRARHLPN